MNGLDNSTYVLMLVISNVVALLQLLTAVKWPRIARLSFFLLFAWACWINWKTSQQTPHFYLEYGDLTWSGWYRNFINGWFKDNIPLAIGIVATCQGLIALSMLLKGWIYTTGSIGAILFLLAILPFGVGSGFPCTAIMAAAVFILIKNHSGKYVWERNHSARSLDYSS